MDIEKRKVSFPSGSLILEGMLSIPSNAGGRGAVLCHPHPLHGGEMRNLVLARVSDALVQEGFSTLRFNFRGVGKSQGGYDEGRGETEDVMAAVDFLLKELALPGVDLAGYSFGSWVGMLGGAAHPGVRRLVGIAPPLSHMDLGEAGNTAKPKFFVRGGKDEYCGEEDFRRWFNGLPDPKEEKLLPAANHFFQGFEMEIARAVSEYLKK